MTQQAIGPVGRSIRLFLVEGAATGLIIVEIVNWTGKVIVVPRAALAHFLARPEATNAGVYILSGVDPEEPLRPLIYVGESEAVGKRLRNHDKDDEKEFYDRAIVFISKDENLTKAHARYLEGRLVSKIKEADRAKSLNGNDPGLSPLPEADRSDMEFFLTQLDLVFPVLGLDILRPQAQLSKKIESKQSSEETHTSSVSPTFIFADAGTNAEAQEVGNEFIVKVGSLAKRRETPTIKSASRLLRKQLIDDNVLVPSGDDLLLFTKDVAFKTPSGAGGVVYGGSVNGRASWKEKSSNMSYGAWRERSLENSIFASVFDNQPIHASDDEV